MNPTVEKPFQHLAFFQHAKTVLRPFRAKKKHTYRVGRIMFAIHYSKPKGAFIEVEWFKATTEPDRPLSGKQMSLIIIDELNDGWRVRPKGQPQKQDILSRIENWRIEVENRRLPLSFQEFTVCTALFAFTPPSTPP